MNRIAELRKSRGMTQAKLAEMLDTSVGMVSMLEKGERRLNTGWTEKLAEIFDVKQSEIWDKPSKEESLYELLDRAVEEAKKRNDEFTSETLKMLMERQKK